MDHLPRRLNPEASLSRVRLYASPTVFDHGSERIPFMEYVDRVGWTLTDIIMHKSSGKTRDELHQLLQAWFYFGIVSELIQEPVTIEDVTEQHPEDPGPHVRSTAVAALIEAWIARAMPLDDSTLRHHLRHIWQCMLTATEVLNDLSEGDETLLEPDLQLSLQLLYEMIMATICIVENRRGWPLTIIHECTTQEGSVAFLATRRAVTEQMELAGWCPSAVRKIGERLTFSELIYASMLDPPGRDKDHGQCTSYTCNAYQVVDESLYLMRHASPGCSCELVYAAQDELVSILCPEDGHVEAVPIIIPEEPRRGADGRLYVALGPSRTSSSHVEYVAISHVWSDGMGNPDANAIHLCVFRELAERVRRLPDETGGTTDAWLPIWLDTLCFPLAPQSAYDAALIRMRQSYEDAKQVLVLDAYLLATQGVAAPPEEVAMRVFCAPWNRRLWTLQEGLLARTLFFQFTDGAVNLARWVTEPRQPALSPLTLVVTWGEYFSLRGVEKTATWAMNLAHARRALGFRTTSVAADEPLCLTTVLGIDPRLIVETRCEGDEDKTRTERMKVIYREMKHFPSGMIFWQNERMQDDGFRWAPASLIEACAALTTTQDAYGADAEFIPGRGLSVNFPALHLACSAISTDRPLKVLMGACRLNLHLTWPGYEGTGMNTTLQRETGGVMQTSNDLGFVILLLRPLSETYLNQEDIVQGGRLCTVADDGLAEMDTGGVRVRSIGKVLLQRDEGMPQGHDKDQAADGQRDAWEGAVAGTMISDGLWCVD